MTTFSLLTKNTATYSNLSKTTTSPSLLAEDSSNLLLENDNTILLESAVVGCVEWINLAKN